MTLEEHSLMILLYARQMVAIKALIDALKSRDLLTDEDLKLFDLFALDSELKNPQIYQKVAESYSAIAKRLGLDVPVQPRASGSTT